MTAGRPWTTTAFLLSLWVVPAVAQSSTGFSHRPWFGVGLGWGTLTAIESEGPNGLLAASLEVPIVPVAGVRVSAERIWSSARDYGGASLRQLSADLMTRRTISRTSTCDMQAVVGIGMGLYRFTIESGPPDDPTRSGFQLSVGADCAGDRLAIGGLFGFRFIDAPDHPAFSSDLVIAPSLTMTVRIRF